MNAQNEKSVQSPCKRKCQLSERQVCVGCGRTIDDITNWPRMSEAAKQKCVDDSAARLEALTGIFE